MKGFVFQNSYQDFNGGTDRNNVIWKKEINWLSQEIIFTWRFLAFSPPQYRTCLVCHPPTLAKYWPQFLQTTRPSSSTSGKALVSTFWRDSLELEVWGWADVDGWSWADVAGLCWADVEGCSFCCCCCCCCCPSPSNRLLQFFMWRLCQPPRIVICLLQYRQGLKKKKNNQLFIIQINPQMFGKTLRRILRQYYVLEIVMNQVCWKERQKWTETKINFNLS